MEDVFFHKFCEHLMEAGELESADRVAYQGQPGRGIRVDGYGGDPAEDDSDTFSLLISDFHPSADVGRLIGSEMNTIFRRLSNFLRHALDRKWRDALEETSPAFGLADLLSKRWTGISRVRLFLITNRALSERVDGREADELDGRTVTYSVWDIGRLYRQATVGHGREDIDVNLAGSFGGPLPVLPAQQPEADHESYLAIMPGQVLAAIYDQWGTRLLEQNVRVFLQHRGKVNKGIRATIENEPNMFFAYNNGITATAEQVEIEDDGGRLLLRRLKNFQIVNGGQTTASIHSAQRRQVDVSQTFVQMKLSVVDPERANRLVPKISEFANSQNRVSAADFFANHPFHVCMEEFSRRIYAPSPDGTFRESKWFYERARGQYADARGGLTPAQRKKFDLENPRRQLFTKTDLARVRQKTLPQVEFRERSATLLTRFCCQLEALQPVWKTERREETRESTRMSRIRRQQDLPSYDGAGPRQDCEPVRRRVADACARASAEATRGDAGWWPAPTGRPHARSRRRRDCGHGRDPDAPNR